MKIAPIPAVALVALGMVAAPIIAQAQAQQQKQMQRQSVPTNFSEEELKSYVHAALEVQQINQTYSKRLRDAETPESQRSMRKEATGKMVKAIKDEGLTVEKYNAIYQAASTDPALAKKVRKHLQEVK